MCYGDTASSSLQQPQGQDKIAGAIDGSTMAAGMEIPQTWQDEASLPPRRTQGFLQAWDDVRMAAATGHGSTICALAVAHGLVFSASADGSVRIWSATSATSVGKLVGHSGAVLSLAVSGTMVYGGAEDGSIRAWRLSDRACVAVLSGHEGPVWALALSTDGTRLYSGAGDGCINVWGARSDGHVMQLLHREEGHHGSVYALLLANSCLYSAASDGQIRVWLVGHQGSEASSPSASADGGLRTPAAHPQPPFPQPGRGSPPGSPPRYSGNTASSAAQPPLSPRSRLTVGSTSAPAFAQILAADHSGLPEGRGDGGSGAGSGPGLVQQRSQSEQFLAASPRGAHEPLIHVASYNGHSDEVLSLCFANGFLFSGSADGHVRGWRPWTARAAAAPPTDPCLFSFRSNGPFVRALASDGDALFVGAKEVEIWMWSEPGHGFRRERMWDCHMDCVVALAAAPPPAQVAGSSGIASPRAGGRQVGPAATLVSGGMDSSVLLWWRRAPLQRAGSSGERSAAVRSAAHMNPLAGPHSPELHGVPPPQYHPSRSSRSSPAGPPLRQSSAELPKVPSPQYSSRSSRSGYSSPVVGHSGPEHPHGSLSLSKYPSPAVLLEEAGGALLQELLPPSDLLPALPGRSGPRHAPAGTHIDPRHGKSPLRGGAVRGGDPHLDGPGGGLRVRTSQHGPHSRHHDASSRTCSACQLSASAPPSPQNALGPQPLLPPIQRALTSPPGHLEAVQGFDGGSKRLAAEFAAGVPPLVGQGSGALGSESLSLLPPSRSQLPLQRQPSPATARVQKPQHRPPFVHQPPFLYQDVRQLPSQQPPVSMSHQQRQHQLQQQQQQQPAPHTSHAQHSQQLLAQHLVPLQPQAAAPPQQMQQQHHFEFRFGLPEFDSHLDPPQ